MGRAGGEGGAITALADAVTGDELGKTRRGRPNHAMAQRQRGRDTRAGKTGTGWLRGLSREEERGENGKAGGKAAAAGAEKGFVGFGG